MLWKGEGIGFSSDVFFCFEFFFSFIDMFWMLWFFCFPLFFSCYFFSLFPLRFLFSFPFSSIIFSIDRE